MSKNKEWLPTEKIIEDYHLYNKMLIVLASEIRELSKKKQDGTLNLTKVKMINRVLSPLKNEILVNIPSSIFLDTINEDELPNNSDAVLIFSQYEAAIEEFANKYHRTGHSNDDFRPHSYWATVENPTGGFDISEDDQ